MGSAAEGLSPFARSLRVSLRYNFFSFLTPKAPERWSKEFFSALLMEWYNEDTVEHTCLSTRRKGEGFGAGPQAAHRRAVVAPDRLLTFRACLRTRFGGDALCSSPFMGEDSGEGAPTDGRKAMRTRRHLPTFVGSPSS